MKFFKFITLACLLFTNGCKEEKAFDYARLIHLDAENLCEWGMAENYEQVIPTLKEFTSPQPLIEIESKDSDDYLISIGGVQYSIYIHEEDDAVACAEKATNVFFYVINKQMLNTNYKFYAFYNGHDLHGAFLNPQEVKKITTANSDNRYEWPYIPNDPMGFHIIGNEK